MIEPAAHKYHNLDGLRGLAALIVLFWHYTIGFLPFLVGTELTVRHTPLDKAIANTPLFLPFAGTFSVYIFFVLSGFVLSLSFFKRQDRSVLVSGAARRYVRLMVPAAGSIILAFLALSILGRGAHLAAAHTTGSSWLGFYWNFTPNIFAALYQGLYGVFFRGDNTYNTNLWTMQLELAGSFIIFGFLALFGKLSRRWVLYLALILIFIKTSYPAFLLGVAICDVWTNHPDWRQRITAPLATGLLITGLVLGSWRQSVSGIFTPFYAGLGQPYFKQTEVQVIALTLGAVCLIIAVLRLPWLSRFFESRPLQYLGRISFSLYLLHWIVLYSFSSLLFNRLLPHAGYAMSFGVMFVISLGLIFAASTLYTRYVDAFAISWSKRFGNWLLSSRRLRPSEANVPEAAIDRFPAVD